MAVFNSKEYEWSDITVAIDGNILGGITNVEYNPTKEKEAVYGRGSNPRGIQHGNRSYEGTVSLLQAEFDQLTDAVKNAGYKDVLEPSFDITISYLNAAGVPRVDVLKFAEFTGFGKGMAQNDKNMEIELPIIALDLEENV